MTITARTPASGTGSGGGTPADITITKATGTANDDHIIVAVCSDGNTSGTDWAPNPSTNWNQYCNLHPTHDGQFLNVWWKKAASEGASWTFRATTNGNDFSWGSFAWSGVHTTTPNDATPVSTTDSGSNTSVVSCSLTGITPVTDGAMLVCIAGGDPDSASSGSWGTPSGFTNRVSLYSNFAPLKVCELLQTSHGASGTITPTLTFTGGAAGFAGIMIALRDASASPPGSGFFRNNPGGHLSGLGSGGPFFQNPLQRVAQSPGFKRLRGVFVPRNFNEAGLV